MAPVISTLLSCLAGLSGPTIQPPRERPTPHWYQYIMTYHLYLITVVVAQELDDALGGAARIPAFCHRHGPSSTSQYSGCLRRLVTAKLIIESNLLASTSTARSSNRRNRTSILVERMNRIEESLKINPHTRLDLDLHARYTWRDQ